MQRLIELQNELEQPKALSALTAPRGQVAPLTIEQIQKKLLATEGELGRLLEVLTVFERVDADQSGYIDHEEFHQALCIRFGPDVTKEEARLSYATLDTNGDNKACFEEVFEFFERVMAKL